MHPQEAGEQHNILGKTQSVFLYMNIKIQAKKNPEKYIN